MEGIVADWYRDQEYALWDTIEATENTDELTGFEPAFIERFTSPSQLDWVYRQYNDLTQGKKSIEEFAHSFRELR